MAIAPIDPRYPDLSNSDVLAQQSWAWRGARSAMGLDVTSIKIAVDFQTMTAATVEGCLAANLELLRQSTGTDTAFHIAIDAASESFTDIAVARGMLATGNPEQLRGQGLKMLPWFRTRLTQLRVSELRDT